MTVAVALFALPHEFVTRTQYDVVLAGATLIELPVPPEIGLDVLPEVPMYH